MATSENHCTECKHSSSVHSSRKRHWNSEKGTGIPQDWCTSTRGHRALSPLEAQPLCGTSFAQSPEIDFFI